LYTAQKLINRGALDVEEEVVKDNVKLSYGM
jgi:hypothetical protein